MCRAIAPRSRRGGRHDRARRTRFLGSEKNASRPRSDSSAPLLIAQALRARRPDRAERWPCGQYRPSRTSYLVGLPRLGIARATQSAVHAINRAVSTIGGPNSFAAWE